MDLQTAVQGGSPVYTSLEIANLQRAVRATTEAGDEVELTFEDSGAQSVSFDPNEVVLDQFVERPSNTFLVGSLAPNARAALFAGVPVAEEEPMTLPPDFDARTKWPDALTIPMEQGECGGCWAFSSATALSDRIRIKDSNNKDLRLLVQYRPFSTRNITYNIFNNLNPYLMVSCDKANLGCQGGYLKASYDYLKNTGLPTLVCNPPNPGCNPAKQNGCPCTPKTDCMLYKATRVYSVIRPSDNDQAKQRAIQTEVFLRGPVTVGFPVYPSFNRFFQANPKGVYTAQQVSAAERAQNPQGHAVNIIGWGSQPSPHWLIRNSWSPLWGQDGLFRLEYNFKVTQPNGKTFGVMDECWAAEA